MNFPIVPEYQNDILNTNPENQVNGTGEPFTIPVGAKKGYIVVPVHAPFFVRSLKLFNENGQELVCGDKGDYRIYKIMGALTNITAQDVSCMIEILNPDLRSGRMHYDIVGEFSLFDSAFLRMIIAVANDDRPIWWDNLRGKPQWFRPKLHSHSLLYEIVAMKDMVGLVDDLLTLLKAKDRTPLEMKFDHYLRLITHYIKTYKAELLPGLQRHAGAYNAHGWSKATSGLEKVDNFPTARGAELLQPRQDRHITPDGIKTIMGAYGFNSSELLAQNKLPISQFGNTNFIPPSIDGSFEGIGGIIETGGSVLESDGTITNLSARMDGRVRGLYFSTLDNSTDGRNISLNFTGYKYEHAKFNADNTNVDRIAQGSGSECILVGDSVKGIYYLGLTNGSNDPANHVYSKINLMPLVDAIYTPGLGYRVEDIFGWINIAVMGEWIYLFMSTEKNAPSPVASGASNMNYRHIFRVPIATVQTTVDVTPVRQNVSFMDADGVQVNNSPWFRWYSITLDANGAGTKAMYTFSPYPSNGLLSGYRSTLTLVAKDPSNPNQYAVKFLQAYYAAHSSPGVNGQINLVPEINYDFNPYTGVFTLKSKTPVFNIDFSKQPAVPPEQQVNYTKNNLVFFYKMQGCNVLDDGRIISSGAFGFSGFPRGMMSILLTNSNTRYGSVSRLWDTGKELTPIGGGIIAEKTVTPTESGLCPRAFMHAPGGEYYVSSTRTDGNRIGMYWKTVSGKFAVRPEITNLLINNIVSRPLTNDIRKINSLPGLGGACLSVPSAALDANGIEVGEMAFCVNSQKRNFNRELIGGAWPLGVGDGDIILTQTHARRIEPDGSITIVPTSEILYPEAIVERLKAEVEFTNRLPGSRSTIVTVSDPTFSSLARFGWLPVVVSIQYTGANGGSEVNTLFTTFMVITPTYTDSGGRKVVTGFTVANKQHTTIAGAAMNVPYTWGSGTGDTPLSTIGPMRCFYYLEGNTVSVYMDPGVICQTVGDAYIGSFYFSITNRTQSTLWNFAEYRNHSSSGGGPCMTPDNGISFMIDWAGSTGSAATLQRGRVNNPLLGGVYPEVGWTIFFKTDIKVAFNGKGYMIPSGSIDLRNIVPNPANKTFYIYAMLRNGNPVYEVAEDKRLETPFMVWAGTVVTGTKQIITVERFNVSTVNASRVSEIKRGNSIPATSGLANEEGQLPWLRNDELLP